MSSTTKRSSSGSFKTSSVTTSSVDTYEFSFPSETFDRRPKKRKKTNKEENTLDPRYKFTLMRMQKEEFRKLIVDLIKQPNAFDKGDFETSNNDENLAKFYFYIRNGLDTLHVAPMEPVTAEKILSLISKKHKEAFGNFIKQLLREIKQEFLWTMKKSIIDFALQDSTNQDQLEVCLTLLANFL